MHRRFTMKTTFIGLLTMAIMLIPACTQNIDTKTEKTTLLNSDKAWANAAASGDIKQISQYWTDNAINYFPGQAPAFGKKAILEIVKRNRSMPGFSLNWEPKDAIVSESGDLGYTHGSYKLSFNNPEGNVITRSGNYVCIWKKQTDGSWKCVLESSVPGPKPD